MKKIFLGVIAFTLMSFDAFSSGHQVFELSFKGPRGFEYSERLKIYRDGLVLSQTNISQDECRGTYVINSQGYLNIVFDGFHGPGTGGGCHNASLAIDVAEFDVFNMKLGKKRNVTFKAVRFFDFSKDGILERLK